jgi:dTDP-glucose 4,6-dehydratase
LTVAGDGSQTRSIQYVTDLVEGCLRLLHSELPGPVNIGNPCEVSITELAVLIRDLVGSASPLQFGPRPEDDPTVRQPDIGLAGEALGWAPTVSLTDGLRTTIAWFRENLDRAAPQRAM